MNQSPFLEFRPPMTDTLSNEPTPSTLAPSLPWIAIGTMPMENEAEAIVGGEAELASGDRADNSAAYTAGLGLRANPGLLEPETIEEFSKLNRADLDELKAHEHLLDYRQSKHLKSVQRKVELYPQRFRDPNYLAQSAILLLSPGWASAERYSCCCIPNLINPTGACRLHRFCPYCSWYEGRKVQLSYVPVFDETNWHFLTGSYTGELEMALAADANTWLCYWDAYKAAFSAWVESGAVNGVYWVEELAVNSLQPIKVLPHVHAIVDAGYIEETDLQDLSVLIERHLEAELASHLEPNLQLKNVTSQRSLMDHLAYLHKPINLLKAYEKAWAPWYNRHAVVSLNSQATDLVLGYSHVNNRRPKMHAKGTLNPKAKQFIGIPTSQHPEYKETLAALRTEASEYIEIAAQPEEET